MGVLFDLDGVLVDSRAPITACLNHALEAVGRPSLPVADLEGFIGPPLADAFAQILEADVESGEVAACVAAYRKVYGPISLRETTVYPGVPEMLEALAGRALGVATSKPAAFAGPILEALGLRDYFTVLAGPDLRTRGEDKTATVAAAVEQIGGADAMVGDRSFDMRAARAHGLIAIGATWGIGTREELLEAGADHLADHPSDVPGLLAAA